jgi:hypothetical protein
MNSILFVADNDNPCAISVCLLPPKAVLLSEIKIWWCGRGWIMDLAATRFPPCRVFQAQPGYIFDPVCHEPQFTYWIYLLTVNDNSGETLNEEKERRDVCV